MIWVSSLLFVYANNTCTDHRPRLISAFCSNCLDGKLNQISDHQIRSSMQNVQASVPQGSVLGPVLFLLFVNGLPLFINETYIELYADDAIVHYANKNKNVVQMKLQNGTDGFLSWCLSNNMFVHFQKTSAMWVGVWQTLQGLDSLDIYLANEKIQQVESQ